MNELRLNQQVEHAYDKLYNLLHHAKFPHETDAECNEKLLKVMLKVLQKMKSVEKTLIIDDDILILFNELKDEWLKYIISDMLPNTPIGICTETICVKNGVFLGLSSDSNKRICIELLDMDSEENPNSIAVPVVDITKLVT